MIVRVPFGHGVHALFRAAGGENRLPQRLHRLMPGEVREDLLRPGRARHGCDAPLIAPLHLIAVGLHDFISRLTALGGLGLIHALEPVGILAVEIDAHGQIFDLPAQLLLLPLFHRAERLHALMADVELCERLVLPFHAYLARAGLVALVHEHRHEVALVNFGHDDHVLPLLNPAALDGDQTGIIAQYGFFHFISSFLGCSGSVTVKTVPLPSVLLTAMVPPCSCTIWRTMLRPSPMPPVRCVSPA